MRLLLSISLLLVSALGAFSPPTNPVSLATQTASAPTTQSAKADRVERLIEALGDRKYQTRESAHRQLAAMGDRALAQLAAAIQNPNPEVARRAQMLMRRPDDPVLRIKVVRCLIATTDPKLMEQGVYMLFRAPVTDYPLFKEVTDNATGIERAMFDPICEQMKQWRDSTLLFERRQSELIKTKPEAAERERNMHADTLYYQAEAAYWSAMDAVLDYREAAALKAQTTSQPAGATTRPAIDGSPNLKFVYD